MHSKGVLADSIKHTPKGNCRACIFCLSLAPNGELKCAGGCKDLDLMQRLAKESNVPLPLADIIMSHEREAERQGNGNKDWGCIADVIRDKASLGKR